MSVIYFLFQFYNNLLCQIYHIIRWPLPHFHFMNSPIICTTVFSYAGGTDIVKRHLPLWQAHSDFVILVYPENSASIVEGVEMVAFGKSTKNGTECLKRQLAGMQYSLRHKADYYVFLEYDAFLLQRPPPRTGIQANVFYTQEIEYHAPRFYHFPWIFDATSLHHFVATATFEPFENGFVDRWVAAQTIRMNIPWFDLTAAHEGYSRNTIRLPEEIRDAVHLARKGAYGFHGIKAPEILKQILRAHTNPSSMAMGIVLFLGLFLT